MADPIVIFATAWLVGSVVVGLACFYRVGAYRMDGSDAFYLALLWPIVLAGVILTFPFVFAYEAGRRAYDRKYRNAP